MHQGDILPECGPSSAWGAFRGCFIQRARLRLSEMSLEKRFVSALQGFGARCRPPGAPRIAPPRRPRVAGVGGGDADYTEAEPFAAKRSETG